MGLASETLVEQPRRAAILPLPEAISRTVADGSTIALEGFTHLIPFAAGHEILRQGRTDLTLVRMTPDILYDQLIGRLCRQGQRADRVVVHHVVAEGTIDETIVRALKRKQRDQQDLLDALRADLDAA